MAVTIEKTIDYKDFGDPVLLPVASGETIYKGTIAVIDDDGYLRNLSSTYAPQGRIVALVKDDSANETGPAATTAAGSISGTSEAPNDDAGDKTCRLCFLHARVKLTFTAIAQSDVGKTVYASDNYTVDETQISGIKIGTLISYISATSGWVMLNTYYEKDGYVTLRGPLIAVTGTTGGGIMSVANPFGETAMIKNLVIDVTTKSTGAANGEFGVAADGTTSSSTLINTCDLGAAAAVFTALTDGGSAGRGYRKWTTTQYVTGTASATLAGIVGTYEIEARAWE